MYGIHIDENLFNLDSQSYLCGRKLTIYMKGGLQYSVFRGAFMNILSICKEKFMNGQINSGTLTGYFRKTWILKEVSGFSETYIDALEDTMHKFQIDYVESGVFTDKWLDKTVRDRRV